MTQHLPYRYVWLIDFEFRAPDGDRPEPLCLVAREVRSGRTERVWLTDNPPAVPPFSVGPESLFVAFYASAEIGCFLALGWPVPARVLDLFAEFRMLTNGITLPHGQSLLGALLHFGLDALDAAEKEQWRELAMRGGPYTADEKNGLLEYCESDVTALARLLPLMVPRIDLPRALLRGRYMIAVARMEWVGVPVDLEILSGMRTNWDQVKSRLVVEVNRLCGVFVPADHPLDRSSRFGAAVREVAGELDLDPYLLADATLEQHRIESEASAGRLEAIRAARHATGLTLAKINRLTDAGKDHLDVRGFDIRARQLASEWPDLGIGVGYDRDGVDDDVAPRLWDLLTQPDPVVPAKHDPALIRRAAEQIGSDDRYSCNGPMRFSSELFAQFIRRKGIAWPRLDSGRLALDDDTFSEMAKLSPAEIGPIREIRHTLGQMRLNELAVGEDGRNRCLLSAFRSKTGRNQPSNSRFVFGPSCWLRSLIRPEPGRALAYVDWSQQELGIAAALSRDPLMMEAYRSGDFYLTFAKMAGAVPPDATKKSHPTEREQYKTVALGVMFGLTGDGIARKLGVTPCQGRELLAAHQRTFRRFWAWSDSIEERAVLTGRLRTTFGWSLIVGAEINPRSVRNFPMQANGAEMMRIAACLATERGIRVCCPVHDAFLIEADAGLIDAEAKRMQAAMREASEFVLPGFPLGTDVKIVRHPERYSDKRGEQMWGTVTNILAELTAEQVRPW